MLNTETQSNEKLNNALKEVENSEYEFHLPKNILELDKATLLGLVYQLSI